MTREHYKLGFYTLGNVSVVKTIDPPPTPPNLESQCFINAFSETIQKNKIKEDSNEVIFNINNVTGTGYIFKINQVTSRYVKP